MVSRMMDDLNTRTGLDVLLLHLRTLGDYLLRYHHVLTEREAAAPILPIVLILRQVVSLEKPKSFTSLNDTTGTRLPPPELVYSLASKHPRTFPQADPTRWLGRWQGTW